MKLELLALENFRQYYGKHKLSFAKSKEQNVTIIHGINGAGKTSLFLAINWCLYGRNVEQIKVVDNVGNLVSKEAIKQSEPGQEVKTSVYISFSHNASRFIVKRTLTANKLPNGKVVVSDSDQFTMMRQTQDGKTTPITNPLGAMNAILPVNAREYFFFDGEKIDNFAKPEAAAQIKEAIHLVLKLEMLQRSQRHLEKTATTYRKELKNSSSDELRTLLENVEQERQKREWAIQKKQELENERESAQRKIKDIDEKLRDSKNATILQQRRDYLQKDITQRQTELSVSIEAIRSNATASYTIMAKDITKKALSILNTKRERGEIPSNIRQQLIQDLLDTMKCICGRSFIEHSEEHKKLLSLLNQSVSRSLEDDVLNTSAILHNFVDKNRMRFNAINANMQKRTELIDMIQNLEAELDDVSRQLKNSPLEEIRLLEQQRNNFSVDIVSYSTDIGAKNQEIDQLTNSINELDKKITQAQKKEKQEKELNLKYELAQKAADAISAMYQVHADNMREQIEACTKEIFRSLVWKDSHFQDIQLDSNFNLEVIDRYGQPARPELSAGERQVLSLSFIMAMAQVSDEEAPLVMDTPFGRLSSHHRSSITEKLPKLASQLILFVTDEELRDEARHNLEDRIGAEYRLNFDRSTSCTTIEEVSQ